MSLLRRAARLAVLTLTLTGFLSTSSAGYANEVERSLAPSTLSAAPNASALNEPTIPQPTPAVLIDTAVATAPRAQFASLADAVAAQDGAGAIEDEHLRCLAGAVYFEAKGEPLAGQLAVAQVILNRAKSGRYPADVCGVVTQRGQFSFVRSGEVPPVPGTRAAYQRAIAVAKVALANVWDSPVPTALFFNAARAGHGGATRVAAIGNHIFYR